MKAMSLAALALASTGAVVYAVAPAQSDPAPIAVELLTPRAVLVDDIDLQIRNKVAGEPTEVRNLLDPSRTVTGKITVQPGARFPWHTHPGPVQVTIASGSLTYVDADDCSERTYPTGSAFWDVGNHVHSAYNPGTTEMVLYATWYQVPETGPLTIPVAAPPCA